MTINHHATKTYRDRAACAGSGVTMADLTPVNPTDDDLTRYSRFYCPECGRTNISLTFGKVPAMGTHLHEQDLASRSRRTNTATAAPVKRSPWVPTQEQHDAIKAFCDNEGADTYHTMVDLMPAPEGLRYSYVTYAKRQGWKLT